MIVLPVGSGIGFGTSLYNPPDRVQKVFGHVKGLMRVVRQDIVQVPETVAGFDQYPLQAGIASQFHIRATIADDIGAWHVDRKLATRLFNQTCSRLSAVACSTVFRDLASRVMRAEKDPVENRPFPPQRPLHVIVHLMNQFDGKISAGHPGLIRDDDGQVLVAIQQPDGLGTPRHQYEAANMIDISHLLVNRPIPVYENRRSFQ